MGNEEVVKPEGTQDGVNPDAPAINVEAFERMKADLFKAKKEAQELKKLQEDAKLSTMKQKEEWQKIAELKEQEAKDAMSKAESLQRTYLNDRKYNAVREAALKSGMRPEALQDLDLISLDDVAVETTSSGKINVLGADQFVNKIKASRPYWFGSKAPPNVNTSDPGLNLGGEVTIDQILAADNKGDRAAYKSLHAKYVEQQKKKR